MTTDRPRPTDFDRLASAWLADGPTELVDRVLDAALREVHSTHQRRALRVSWRFPLMRTGLRSASATTVAAAAIVLVGILAFNLRTPDAGPGSSDETRSPAPTATPALSPDASGSADGQALHGDVGRVPGTCFDVPAGASYRNDLGADYGDLALTVNIPGSAGIAWQSIGGPAFSLVAGCYQFFAPTGPFIDATVVTYVDGTCEIGDAVPVTSTAEAVTAVARARGVAVSQPASVSLGGRAATRFEVAPGARICFPGVNLWDGFGVEGASILYLVDVDGLPIGIRITGFPDSGQESAIAEAEAIVASLRIDARPGARPSRGPVPTADAACTQLNGTGRYTAAVGPVSVTATVPDDSGVYWSGGGWFDLRRAPCGFDAPVTLHGLVITRVAVDACRGMGDSVEVRTLAGAVTALAEQASTNVTEQTDLTIDGRPAVRFRLSPEPGLGDNGDGDSCEEGATLLLGQGVEDAFLRIHWATTVYLVDVDGTIVAIAVSPDDDAEDPAIRTDVDAIIDSLKVAAPGG